MKITIKQLKKLIKEQVDEVVIPSIVTSEDELIDMLDNYDKVVERFGFDYKHRERKRLLDAFSSLSARIKQLEEEVDEVADQAGWTKKYAK